MEMLIYVLLLYSHFVKHHEIRKETPRILWQYGNILSDGIPFIIINSQELQCQYGHPKNYNSKVNIIIIVISVAYNLNVNNRDLLMIMIHMYGKPECIYRRDERSDSLSITVPVYCICRMLHYKDDEIESLHITRV